MALVVLIAGVAARLAAPRLVRAYVNRVIDQDTEYDGRIGKVELHLWRGAYTIHDLEIVKTTNSVPVPFYEARRVDFSLDWPALLHGGARGRVRMERPRINFVHAPDPEGTQTGANQPWLAIMDELFPFRIDRAEVEDGEIHFQAFHTRPPVDVYLSEVHGVVTNLTNVENKLDPLMATVSAWGTAMESGRFEFGMKLDPMAHRPTFDLAARLLDVDVEELNSLARAYGNFDFEGGKFDLVVDVQTKDGFLTGYAKPLFRGARIVSLRDVGEGLPPQLLWEGVVEAVGMVFRNQPRAQFGTSIALEGEFEGPRTNILRVVGNVLRNAFIQAYLPRFEGRTGPGVEALQEGAGGGGR